MKKDKKKKEAAKIDDSDEKIAVKEEEKGIDEISEQNEKRKKGSLLSKQKKPRNVELMDTFGYSIVCIIIVLVLLLFALSGGITHYNMNYHENDEYPEQITDILLIGTIPKVNYTDSEGQETIFIDHSVKQLIIEDIRIRLELTPYEGKANIESLEQGIEAAVKSTLDQVIDDSHTYSLNVTWSVPDRPAENTYFQVKGKEFPSDKDQSDPISKYLESYSISDFGRTEIGSYEFEVTLSIYEKPM